MMINGEEHNELCAGIDLGTTNSALAVIIKRPNGNIVSKVIDIDRAVGMVADGVEARPSMESRKTLPSCVYYIEERKYMPIVGDFAKSRYSIRPYLVAKSIKSQMGNATVDSKLSPNIPDKTPSQVSARILSHMLKYAAKTCRVKEIKDAVITVPANFDSVMWQATLKAAEIAGLKIHKKQMVLLEEPVAVIYDFINQVNNGEIPDTILDLSTPKNVMVFDLGGGTLDITLHTISRREDTPEVLNTPKPLGINRYTLLGGDDFDTELAEVMFERYLAKYRANLKIVKDIKDAKESVMAQLKVYAEETKIALSMDKSDEFVTTFSDDPWNDDEEDGYRKSGLITATGYFYDETFSAQELEKIWSRFMGREFTFDDFKNFDETNPRFSSPNIIVPILEVLRKAADKLGTTDFKVDAVIMNGGMSRFYMIRDRLAEFFGFKPVMALDPDQAVARGAAVFHYLLHKYNEIFAETPVPELSTLASSPEISTLVQTPLIQTILPDSLFMKMQDTSSQELYKEIIATGTELPYKSEVFTGFKIPRGENKISVPIARRNNRGEYVVIAESEMRFPEKYSDAQEDTFVAFTVAMNEQKILRIDACTCRDAAGLEKMDDGTAEIVIAAKLDKAETRSPVKIQPKKTGAPVRANESLNNILDFARKTERAIKRGDKAVVTKYSALIRQEKGKIFAASNPEDFAEPLLRLFSENSSLETFKMNCAIIGRKICPSWSSSQKQRLADLCMQQLEKEIIFPTPTIGGPSVNTKIQAIYALGVCGSPSDLDRLSKLHIYSQFRVALLRMHAITKTDVDWLYSEFAKDCRAVQRKAKNQIQHSAHDLGFAFRLDDPRPTICSTKKSQIVDELCDAVVSDSLNNSELGSCFKALGLLCDRRYPNSIDAQAVEKAQKILRVYLSALNSRDIALKMMDGVALTAEEEEVLLIKLDD